MRCCRIHGWLFFSIRSCQIDANIFGMESTSSASRSLGSLAVSSHEVELSLLFCDPLYPTLPPAQHSSPCIVTAGLLVCLSTRFELCLSMGCNLSIFILPMGFPGVTRGKEPSWQCSRCKEVQVRSLGWEDPLEKGMTTHSSIFA